jgi:asparagine synthase (glutamine-hydrolysing)
MRLICGILRLDGATPDEAALRALAASMRGAGPEPAIASWREGPVALVILDFARDAVAEPCRIDRAVVAADVRLDEPDLVAAALGLPAARQDRLIGETFIRSGANGLADLLGDFALVHWDPRTGVLSCARDTIGVRPLSYVHRPGEMFAFASLASALVESGLVRRKLDRVALAQHMTGRNRDLSLHEGIHRLPPAHLLSVSVSGLRTERYWALDPALVDSSTDAPDIAADRLRDLVEQAVRCRLRGVGPIGTHLSGGLDSSSIAVIAARALRQEGRALHAYSFLDRLRNDVVLEDATPLVEDVLRQESDIVWTPIRPPAQMEPGRLDREGHGIVDAPDTQTSRHSSEEGIDLVLSGYGGDESASYNGRGAVAEQLMRGQWRTLARTLRGMRTARNTTVRAALYTHVFHYIAPIWLTRAIRKATERGPLVMADELQEEFRGPLMREALADISPKRVMTWDARRNRLTMLGGNHIPQGCEIMARMGARHGVAYAFPLLDRRVIEYSMSLPSSYFVKDGIGRAIFRDAMKGILPESIRQQMHKHNPLPSAAVDRAAMKEHWLARLDALEANETAHQWLNLPKVREAIAALPEPEQVAAWAQRGGKTPSSFHRSSVAVTQLLLTELLLEEQASRD